MPLLNDHYTSEDYWNLPEEERAELINGKFYDMAPPSRIHQKLVSKLTALFNQYITDHHGSCEVYPAPFAVNLDVNFLFQRKVSTLTYPVGLHDSLISPVVAENIVQEPLVALGINTVNLIIGTAVRFRREPWQEPSSLRCEGMACR